MLKEEILDTIVHVCGRHVMTEGWETLVWGEGSNIGTAPLGLSIAMETYGRLSFGTGASEAPDGRKEASFTRDYLLERMEELTLFPEFDYFRGAAEAERVFSKFLTEARIDEESNNTESELRLLAEYAESVAATSVIIVTSSGHLARVGNLIAQAVERGDLIRKFNPMIRSAHSSTDKYRADHTVVMEPPHRGDDEMITSSLQPHQLFLRLFKLPPAERKKLFRDFDFMLRHNYGV